MKYLRAGRFSLRSDTLAKKNRNIKSLERISFIKRTALVCVLLALVTLTVIYGLLASEIKAVSSIKNSKLHSYFENNDSQRTEVWVRRIDKGLCNCLIKLGITPNVIKFQIVETRTSGVETWTYSKILIPLPVSAQINTVIKILTKELSSLGPMVVIEPTFTVNSAKVGIRIDRKITHHLLFLKPHANKKSSSQIINKQQNQLQYRLQSKLPELALIIDDLGYDKKLAHEFSNIDKRLSFSILPNSPFAKELAIFFHNQGHDVLVHLPMEPIDYPNINPGDNALLGSMTDAAFLRTLRTHLSTIPFSIGANNHMGSQLTQDPKKMSLLFRTLKKNNLFFIDSYTNPKSVCSETADHISLKFARRNVFLDNDQDDASIRMQLMRLESLASSNGRAIGLGHPYQSTLEVLSKELPNLSKKFNLVSISEFMQ